MLNRILKLLLLPPLLVSATTLVVVGLVNFDLIVVIVVWLIPVMILTGIFLLIVKRIFTFK